MDHLLVLWPFASLGLGMMSMLNLCLKTWSSPEGASDVQSMRSWQRRTRDPQWWMQLALPIYMLHQWEEHGFDLLGRRYSFQGYFCEKLDFKDVTDCPLTPLVIVFVNIATVWSGALLARQSQHTAINFYGFTFVNGLTHVIPALTVGPAYNPGLATTWLLFFPAAYFALRLLGSQVRGVATGVLCHLILMGSMKLAAHRLIGQVVLCLVQVLNVIPLVAFGKSR